MKVRELEIGKTYRIDCDVDCNTTLKSYHGNAVFLKKAMCTSELEFRLPNGAISYFLIGEVSLNNENPKEEAIKKIAKEVFGIDDVKHLGFSTIQAISMAWDLGKESN